MQTPLIAKPEFLLVCENNTHLYPTYNCCARWPLGKLILHSDCHTFLLISFEILVVHQTVLQDVFFILIDLLSLT